MRLHATLAHAQMIDKANIDNYSIYLGEVSPGDHYLFSYYEYTGKDFAADLAKMKKDKTTQEWWKHTDPLQKPLPTKREGEWWSEWQEVFHHDGPAYDRSRIKSRHGSIIGLPEENILAYTQLQPSGPASWRPSTARTSATTPSTWAGSSPASTCCSAISNTSATTSRATCSGSRTR
jgi:L-rhamnose mutarotase